MKLSERSKRNLEGVHQDLVEVWKWAKLPHGYDAVIIDGVRTQEEQDEMLKSGASKTKNSRHLKRKIEGHSDPVACATDFMVIKDGESTWDKKEYAPVWKALNAEAKKRDVKLTWGGSWGWDFGHVELAWDTYPIAGTKPKTAANSKVVAAASLGGSATVFLPDLLDALNSVINVVERIPDGLGKWLQVLLAVSVIAFLVYDRVAKLKREGI